MSKDYRKTWNDRVAPKLIGRKIVGAKYMTTSEVEEMGWHCAALVITLDDGTELVPSRDDEGNDAGALFTSFDDLPIIPVI